ncbi:uncharacterized protein RCC_07568 [Ramularia collo-cygni]|uniref:Zn(2)-C6 fungal-type domain-containing protein n=1 Tax=Ramularia collo-cygni TaxID=112498 RepID=A0A2D3VKS5_9PEZI|nr:uncharacterized protein RCC_07568 [Ramularia collo-cygni]CZT21703.1 uncharacterized protein RCC_07568 [Ramularia collo-cygni]
METPPSTSTKGPSRRPHTKTRLGCNTCKARKVRCDQIKPVCQNCTRGNRTCVYASVSQASSPSTSLSVTPAEAQDLELMHYYTISSHQILSRLPEHYWIWQVQVPRMAFSHKYLLHGLLALTAMHRCSGADESQIPNLVALARYHQQHALVLYIPLLQQIDPDNCHALFAFSIVLTLLSFGMLKSDDHNPQSLINGFTDVCDSQFGAAAVATQAAEWLRHGPLGPTVVPIVQPKSDLSDVDPSVRGVLEPLLQCAQSVCEEARAHQSADEVASRHAAYMTSIMALASIQQEESAAEIAMITAWPVMTTPSYVKLLKERDQLALVILGNYGAVLHICGGQWIIEGLGRRLTEAVYAEVDPGWHPLLAWARSSNYASHCPTPVPASAPTPTPHEMASENIT